MSKRKHGIQSAAAGGPRREHTRRANSKQARDRFKLGNANRDGRYLVRL